MVDWMTRLSEDGKSLTEAEKSKIVKAALMFTTPFLSSGEAETFLTPPENLLNMETLTVYSRIEKKVADAYSGAYGEDSKRWEREKYLEDIQRVLGKHYTGREFEELKSLILNPRDVTALTTMIASDNYGLRRIRNSYLPEITDVIGIDLETGKGKNLTQEFFEENQEDPVSKIENFMNRHEDPYQQD